MRLLRRPASAPSAVFPFFLQFAHTRRLGSEQQEEHCGSTRTVANAHSFHWGVTLSTASVAHILANALTNQLRDTTHTCHFSFCCRWREQTWEEVKRARTAPHHELRATLAICRTVINQYKEGYIFSCTLFITYGRFENEERRKSTGCNWINAEVNSVLWRKMT